MTSAELQEQFSQILWDRDQAQQQVQLLQSELQKHDCTQGDPELVFCSEAQPCTMHLLKRLRESLVCPWHVDGRHYCLACAEHLEG